jgi:outer membrane protein assembly factor BamB
MSQDRPAAPGQVSGFPRRSRAGSPALGRRAALLAPLALSGCGMFDSWFGSNKTPLPGRREDVLAPEHGLQVSTNPPRVVLPPPALDPDWLQPGGNAAHVMGNLATKPVLAQAWRAHIGEGGGYREKITAPPLVAGGFVYAMDSNAVVSAFDLGTGASTPRRSATAAPMSAAAWRSRAAS